MSGSPPVATDSDPQAGHLSTFRAMASDITVRLDGSGPEAASAVGAVEELFRAVERACTRFDPASPLMQANAAGDRWCTVPRLCLDAIDEAWQAHRRSGGLFDPRVLTVLHDLGYAGIRSFTDDGLPTNPADPASAVTLREPWLPRIDRERNAVRIGREPIDLGGIGKGLAVRWAGRLLAESYRNFLLDAGGDCLLSGVGPSGLGWEVGVENPTDATLPVAVLQLRDLACATSSIRIRRWVAGGQPVHHLIDPRTGRPGGAGLLAVTVVERDPADAEVASKTLFLSGAARIADHAAEDRVAALWVGVDGDVGISPRMEPLVIWRAA
ncbi:FAD:protein FMN transferase [Jatrophihabitans sp.]|uniref:FAD:protein FMN transferase n=1 Tax=Jatrophihabitans sp. TaxID=1932789 RepID=UPI0030C660BF|nr:ApbE family lipoprotein [Jatrophihabitans sp.]